MLYSPRLPFTEFSISDQWEDHSSQEKRPFSVNGTFQNIPEEMDFSKSRIEAEVKKTHIAAIAKWSVMEMLEDFIRAKEMVVLKKAERKKRGYEGKIITGSLDKSGV
jgi:hypothetical protein